MRKDKVSRILLAVYIAWTFIQVVCLGMGWNGQNHYFFYPFEDSISEYTSLIYTYDFTEFIVYVGTPAIIYVIYRVLSAEPNKPPTSINNSI